MTFDWEDYLKLAVELAGSNENGSLLEARYRASISRAYYAAMCLTRNHLLQRGELRAPVNNMHKDVLDALARTQNDRQRVKLLNQLTRLKQLRRRADYEDHFPDVQIQSGRVLRQASEVIKVLTS